MIIEGVCQYCGDEDMWGDYCLTCGEPAEKEEEWTPYELAMGFDN